MSGKWIEIDSEVLAAIKGKAEPFADSPNDVLRSLLGLDPAETRPSCSPTPSLRAPVRAIHGALPQREYELPVLLALAAHGGRATRQQILAAVRSELADRFSELELESLRNGEARWENRTSFARRELLKAGLLSPESARGYWQLSEAGWAALGDDVNAGREPGSAQ